MKGPLTRGLWLVCWGVLGFMVVPVSGSFAQELIQEKTIPLTLALKAAQAARQKCENDGYRVSAAVVDAGGVLKALVRSDGAGPHTQDSSFKKAYTALSLRRSTLELARLMVKVPSIRELGRMNENILMLGGGLPIKFGNDVVGGIGVGGAPGAHLDEACARAGLNSIQAAVPESSK